MKKILLLMIALYFLFSSLAAVEIKPLREIEFSHDEENFIKLPGSFFITIDEMVFVCDYKASNIKIYNESGKMINIFGRSGVGPNEFITPFLSAYKEPLVVIGDIGRKSFFIFKRDKKDSLKFVKKFLSLEMAYDLQFINSDKLLICGYKMGNDRKEYNIYEYDFEHKKYNFLIPSEITYGLTSNKIYRKALKEKLRYIGLHQFCDFSDDNIYFVWTGGLKITKFDRKAKEYTSFGHKTGNFVQPTVNPAIKKAYRERNHRLLWKLEKDVSYIVDIFVLNSKKVGVIYYGPFKKNYGVTLTLQLYRGNGEFINEFELKKPKASYQYELFSYYRKDKNLLYIIDTETSEKLDQSHKLYEYRIEE